MGSRSRSRSPYREPPPDPTIPPVPPPTPGPRCRCRRWFPNEWAEGRPGHIIGRIRPRCCFRANHERPPAHICEVCFRHEWLGGGNGDYLVLEAQWHNLDKARAVKEALHRHQKQKEKEEKQQAKDTAKSSIHGPSVDRVFQCAWPSAPKPYGLGFPSASRPSCRCYCRHGSRSTTSGGASTTASRRFSRSRGPSSATSTTWTSRRTFKSAWSTWSATGGPCAQWRGLRLRSLRRPGPPSRRRSSRRRPPPASRRTQCRALRLWALRRPSPASRTLRRAPPGS